MSLRGLPLWLRWVLTLIAVGVIAIALFSVLLGSGESSQEGAAALLRADAATRALISRDQAPHSALLPPGVDPQVALQRAIAADIRERVHRNQLGGPAGGARCLRSGPTKTARLAFKCSARAGRVGYPYVGLVNLHARRLTWCKFDAPPGEQLAVPVSPRCSSSNSTASARSRGSSSGSS